MKVLERYKNGNASVTIWSDGTREIEFPDGEEINLDFPLSIDLCITKYCNRGCLFCYNNSGVNGKHGDIMNLPIIDSLPRGIEVACLSGDTIAYGKNGAIEIKDLKIGDYIFDSDYKLRKIIDIKKKIDDIKVAKLNKGLYVKSTKEHPFISNGDIEPLQDILGKKMDTLGEYKGDYSKNAIKIDMAKYLTKAKKGLKGSTGGRILEDGKLFLGTNSPKIDRYIDVDEDLMWLYGLWVAQGADTTLTINVRHGLQARRITQIWYDKTGVLASIHKIGKVLQVDLNSKRLCDSIFVDYFKVGKGARNKSLEYLFTIEDKELVKGAIIGLYDGDGCYRYRKNSRVASYKTSSKKLAYELLYLLNKFFGIKASLYYGINKRRKIEGRTIEPTDYYMLDIYNSHDLQKIFEKQFSSFTESKPSKNEILCKDINDVEQGTVYDIYLEDGSHIFPINGYILTHNCGGGSATTHPDLKPFLEKLKTKGIIANMTVSQGEFIDNLELINDLIENDLIHGLGISYKEPNDQLWKLIAENKDCVVHLIAGVHTKEVFDYLSKFGLKVLILGYKEIGRGLFYYDALKEQVDKNIQWLKDNLENYIDKFEVISFDNLALKQLSPERLVTPEKWNELYQGDDGTISCYIDAVDKTIHISSLDQRGFDASDDIKSDFDRIKKMKRDGSDD